MDISEHFTESFTAIDLAAAIDACKTNELEPVIVKLPAPVLEAGCGSGKWMHYLKRSGVKAVGVDWSEELRRRSLEFDPAVRFDVGDLRQLSYADGVFSSVLALGSIEHVVEGPQQILAEFHRVLRDDGQLIVTVPHRSPLKRPRQTLRQTSWLRRVTGRQALPQQTPYRHGIFAAVDAQDGFYQYEYTPTQLRAEITEAGFTVEKLWPYAKDYGLYQTFGGTFDLTAERASPRFGLLRLFPASLTGHMLCAVAHRA